MPILLGIRSSFTPLRKEKLAQQIGQTINGSVRGWRWVPVDYLEATFVMLNDLKKSPELYDFIFLRHIRFVPWYTRWIYSVGTALGITPTSSDTQVTLIAYWHPRLFAQELRYKLGNATRRQNVADELITQGWTFAAPRSALGLLLLTEFSVVALTVAGLSWSLIPGFWPDMPSFMRPLAAVLGPVLGAAYSFSAKGMARPVFDLIRGKASWVLDPSKPAMLRPFLSLTNPQTYLKNRIAAEMPQVPLVQSLKRPMAMIFSIVAHIVTLTWLLSFDVSPLLAAGLFTVFLVSAGIATWRLTKVPSSTDSLPIRQSGQWGNSEFIIRQTAAQFIATAQEIFRWLLPFFLILFSTDPSVREKARELWHEVEAPHEFPLTPEALKERYHIQVIPLAPPESKNPGQGGKALDYTAPKPVEPHRSSRPIEVAQSPSRGKTSRPFVAPPRQPVVPREITIVEPPPELPPSSIIAAQPNIPLQVGMGGQRIFEWAPAEFRYFPKAIFGDQKVVKNPFTELTKEQVAVYDDFMNDNYFHVEGDVAGVRLYIEEADEGHITVNFTFGLSDGRIMVKGVDVPVKAWDHATANGTLQEITIWFDKEDFKQFPPDGLTQQAIHLSARARATGGPMLIDAPGRSMRVKVSKVGFLSEEDRKNLTVPPAGAVPPPAAYQMSPSNIPSDKGPERTLLGHAA